MLLYLAHVRIIYMKLEDMMSPRGLDIQHSIEEFAIVSYTDLKGNINYVSELFCKISKYSKKELLGQNHSLLKSGHHDDEFYKEIWNSLSQKNIWKGVICNKAKDGSIYYVDSVIFPYYSDKKLIGYGSIRIDITKQINFEETINLKDQYSQKLMEGVTEGLVIQNSESAILEMNNVCPGILGLTRDQMLGKTSFDPDWGTIYEDGTPCPGEEHPSSVAIRTKKEVQGFIMGVTVPSKGIRWLSINSTYYIDPESKEERTLTSFFDIIL